MKKYIVCVLSILSLSLFCWAQAAKEPFDVKKSQAELEIMKGILGTTAKFVAQNFQKRTSPWNSFNISAYYLVGQGAVFTIPTRPSMQLLAFTDSGQELEALKLREFEIHNRNYEEMMWDAEENLRRNEIQIALAESAWEDAESPSAPPAPQTPQAPQASQAPPSPPAPPAPPQINKEELRKKVEKIKVNIKKSQEEAEENRRKFLQSLAEIKTHLIEALANYGDSMTTIKPVEYINLIFPTENMANRNDGMKSQYDVISVQKSWISDYKAGRLSLDAFKQKVLQYTQ
jgi:hypothetical protein